MKRRRRFLAVLVSLLLSMVVFGGIGTRWGPLVGAVILGVLPEISRPVMEYRTFLYGLLLMLMMRFQPEGLLGFDSVLMRGVRRILPRPSGPR